MDISEILTGYDVQNLSVGSLGGHSGLDVAHGAKRAGLKSVVVAQKGRERTYERYVCRPEPNPRTSRPSAGLRATVRGKPNTEPERGCIDELIVVPKFQDALKRDIQEQLRELNTIFVSSRYFWVYFDDFSEVENDFAVPIFGSRHLLKLEERDQPYNQYHLLNDAGIRIPKVFKKPDDIDRPVLVKASEAKRGYERAFFVASSKDDWEQRGEVLEQEGVVDASWRDATIEEFIVGALVNFNFFYSPLTEEVELLGTDMRRQTNLDGFLRMTAPDQRKALEHIDLKMIETGHIAVTVKESLLEKAFDLAEKFRAQTRRLPKKIDPTGKGIIGPFALQGAVVSEEGREDIVIFDVSMRIPGSPGLRATPYSGYLYGEPMSVGERVGREIRQAADVDNLAEIVT